MLTWLQLTLPEGANVAEVEKTLNAALDEVVAKGVTDAELTRAKNQFAATFWKRLATIDGKASLLGQFDVFEGDYKKLFDAPAVYEKVTKEDVLKAAATGTAEKTSHGGSTDQSGRGPRGLRTRGGQAMKRLSVMLVASLLGVAFAGAVTTAAAAESAPVGVKVPANQRFVLPNGLTIVLVPKKDVPMIAFSGFVRGGSLADPADKPGVGSLVAGLLDRGAGKRNAFEFADALEGVGGTFAAGAGSESINVNGQFLARDRALMIELLADALHAPASRCAGVRGLSRPRDRVHQVGQGFRSFADRRHLRPRRIVRHPSLWPSAGWQRTFAGRDHARGRRRVSQGELRPQQRHAGVRGRPRRQVDEDRR